MEGISVKLSLRTLKLGKQAYYEWLRSPVSRREREELKLLPIIQQIHQDDPEYGYRFITDRLKDMGHQVNEKRIARICSKYKIYASIHKKGRKYRESQLPAHDDLVQRDFTASDVNKLWLTDFTEHPTREGKLYICVIKDVFGNRIVGHEMNERMTAEVATDTLDDAMAHRGYPKEVVVHSDRGGQFRSRKMKSRLAYYEARGSMGQARTCADNSAMESFFSLLQKNVLNKKKAWESRQELRIAVTRWINVKYNQERRQRARNKMSPIEYEAVYGNINSDKRPVYPEGRVR